MSKLNNIENFISKAIECLENNKAPHNRMAIPKVYRHMLEASNQLEEVKKLEKKYGINIDFV